MKRFRIPIIARILGFNILLVFVPVASFLSLDTYEKDQLEALEGSLVQQGRVLAAWLAEGTFSESRAAAVLASLGRRHTARLRVIDAEGRLLADSSSLAGPPPAEGGAVSAIKRVSASLERYAVAEENGAADNPVYRLFSGAARIYRRFAPPAETFASADYYAQGREFLDGQEVRSALDGRYGAATRISAGGQASVTLYSALPVLAADGGVRGVVLTSQSTYRILAGLYSLRLDVARIFLLSLAASIILSVLLWLTISRPLRRLADRARSALTLPSLAEGHFSRGAVSDEIDDLTETLRAFASRLGDRLSWAEDFAADLAHEIRNPLASVRASAELVEGASAAETPTLAGRIIADCDRINRIVGGLRELSRIEAEEAEDGSADALECALNAARRSRESAEARVRDVRVVVAEAAPGAPRLAAIGSLRLGIALGALLDNAVSFSPVGGEVELRLARSEAGGSAYLRLSVLDRGPGLPPGDAERVFDRFFSTRAASAAEGSAAHCGLGLAIVQGIARRSGGWAEAADREGGGAEFALYLRVAR